MIQSMGGVLLPQAYSIATKAKNNLIQVGKISPRPLVPILLDMQPDMPLVVPPFNALPFVPSQEITIVDPSQEL